MNKTQLANYFDHTFLKPYATEADLTKLCNEAKEIGAAMVAINTTWTRFCKEQLKGTKRTCRSCHQLSFRTSWSSI